MMNCIIIIIIIIYCVVMSKFKLGNFEMCDCIL